jgi:hypothetical protein
MVGQAQMKGLADRPVPSATPDDQSNQVRHFTVFFAAGYRYGSGVANWGAYSPNNTSILRPLSGEDTPKDVALGVTAGALGAELTNKSTNQVLADIAKAICE